MEAEGLKGWGERPERNLGGGGGGGGGGGQGRLALWQDRSRAAGAKTCQWEALLFELGVAKAGRRRGPPYTCHRPTPADSCGRNGRTCAWETWSVCTETTSSL